MNNPLPAAASRLSRRGFAKQIAGAALAVASPLVCAAEKFRLRYVLASSMYGRLPLREILPQVRASGAETIDLWPAPHGSQREELDAMGVEKFSEMLREHQVKLEIFTRYDLGPFRLRDEIELAKELGVSTLVTGGSGPVGLSGDDLKKAVFDFVEKMKPHLALAEEKGVTIAIENHMKNLIDAPDSLRWLVEACQSPRLGIALAPYHLPQDAAFLAQLISDLGKRISVFYAWEYGKGCMEKLPKEQELMQMPGRGPLDFAPLLAALKKIAYTGATEIFMHPVPRGIPILDTASEVTAEINRARRYLDEKIAG